MQSTETWKPVVGWENYYEVSSRGKVRSLDRVRADGVKLRGREMQQGRNAKGYKQVKLSIDGGSVTKPVHRLVLEAFVGPAPDGTECCHYNGIPGDNRVENLRWDTHTSNMADKVRHGTNIPARKPKTRYGLCTHGHEMIPENVKRVGEYELCLACWAAHKYRMKYRIDIDTQAHLADINFEMIRTGSWPTHLEQFRQTLKDQGVRKN